MKKIAIVVPWYGLNIPGGTEAASRNLAEKMAHAGEQVEVLTTCVKDFASDWSVNYYKPGTELLNGVMVKRFKVRKRNTEAFDRINKKLMDGLRVSFKEEQVYLEEMINSPDLEQYLAWNKEEYKSIIFTPYMFGTTYHGVQQVLDKAILFPAFHDESYAYFQSFRDVYSRVKGIVFNSIAEKEWAQEHYDLTNVNTKVIGLGIEPFNSDPERFQNKFHIRDPFILYAGRKEHGKNVHVLLEYFAKYHEEHASDLKLVLIGGGQIDVPTSVKQHVADLGFVEEQDKYDAYGAAALFCNPSLFESFSIVIMESWYSGRPVLVSEGCSVTKRFCEVSNGGLYFSNYDEFSTCVDLITKSPDLADQLGRNGMAFVKANFTWAKVIENYLAFITECNKG